MHRPPGVTVIALLILFNGFLTAAGAVILLIAPRSRASGGRGVLAFSLLLTIAVSMIAGYGLLKLKNWGRLLSAAVAVLAPIFSATQILTQMQTGGAIVGTTTNDIQFFFFFFGSARGIHLGSVVFVARRNKESVPERSLVTALAWPETEKGKGHAVFGTWPLFMPATTYSPTHFRVQYHRPSGA